jgi:hypothetical protein
MFASDVTTRNRDLTLSVDLERQKVAFNNRSIIRVLGQKGGNDYPYLLQTRVGFNEGGGLVDTIPVINSVRGNRQVTLAQALSGLTRVSFTTPGITDSAGDIFDISGNLIRDDSSIPIPMGGMSFYFFGVDYGTTNKIYWNTNNAIIFASSQSVLNVLSTGVASSYFTTINSTTIPAILIGNSDRVCFNLYTGQTSANINASSFNIINMVVNYSAQYSERNPSNTGFLYIRLIREITGSNRQWVEVTIINPALNETPGYTRITNTVDSSGTLLGAVDSNGNTIDPTKRSPWDITNGTNFLQAAGTDYSTAFPSAGTTLLYQSDSTGSSWSFSSNKYLNI